VAHRDNLLLTIGVGMGALASWILKFEIFLPNF